MKKVLYVSNIEVPYRVRMFNELAKHCDLTVLYETEKTDIRNNEWAKSEVSLYAKKYIGGKKIKAENSFSLKAVKEIFADYDMIVIGCFNSPVQLLMMLTMRLLRKPYILNLDGEVFAHGKGIKAVLKRFFLKGADKYLVAGNEACASLKRIINDKEMIPYYFSSLSEAELAENAGSKKEDGGFVLVVGQYLDVKGMDVVLECAKLNPDIRYKFVGMGSRTELFKEKYDTSNVKNVEIIPFLKKEDLAEEYKKCSLFVLPSRQECWGLVINEAASYGIPIVSTYGSGAAVEFLSKDYPQYLAIPGDAQSLLGCIESALNRDREEYSRYLIEKSKQYSIEKGVKAHAEAFEL